MKKKGKALLIIFISIILIAAWSVAFYSVNAKYPQLDAENHTMEETVEYSGFEIKVHSVKWIEKDELDALGCFEADPYGKEIDIKGLFVDMSITNISDSEKNFPFYDFYCAGKGWSNGVAMDWLTCIESDEPISKPVEPGETIHITLPYSLYDIQFRKSTWTRVEDMDYYLVYSLYPVKKTLSLNQ